MELSQEEKNFRDFLVGYMKCIYFTEDIPQSYKFSYGDTFNMCIDCGRFLKISDDMKAIPENLYEQAGHDFWLTRNGHGTGFWDRPEMYGHKNADILSEISRSFRDQDIIVDADKCMVIYY